ncbi:hypothetical protein H6F74_02380 [Trichocoleus sp. FACHB-90]|uniref:hypothetical protein n=1 Tax=Cyanophyceae TaxID=3028117 RepID=UPI001688FA48|nr:hypothetical protein [Trichocoleus sp. FACHB-90]MBD1925136.1 hypothetical protein [Trichocoleus sp. FACHB-90]
MGWLKKSRFYIVIGKDYDHFLQYRDGEYSQLLEYLACYHQIFLQGWDRIIVLRPSNYGGYDIQLNAAM